MREWGGGGWGGDGEKGPRGGDKEKEIGEVIESG